MNGNVSDHPLRFNVVSFPDVRRAGAILLASLLFLPWLSINYDLNGILELNAIQSGEWAQLLVPNHLFYRPLVFFLARVFSDNPSNMLVMRVAQVSTSAFASLAVAITYATSRRLGADWRLAALSAIGVGTSWAFWKFGTDVSYIVPAAALISACAYVVVSPSAGTNGAGAHKPFWLGLLTCLAIGFWQANIFAMIGLSILLSVRLAAADIKPTIQLLKYWAWTATFVAIVYLGAALAVVRPFSLYSLYTWGSTYASRLPVWGDWGVERIGMAAVSAAGSIVPLWEGFGLRSLLNGHVEPSKFPALAAAAACMVLALVGCRGLLRCNVKLMLALLLAWLAYIPFIVWWDPY